MNIMKLSVGHKYRQGRGWIKSSPEDKDLGVLVDENLKKS